MEQQQRQQVKKYTDLILRRKKMIFSFLLLGITIGLAAYLKTPKVYESTAMLIYQRAKINPGSKMTPDVEAQTREMVATLSQQVTSRTSLEAIIKQFDLYAEMRQKMPMEDVVDMMREHHIVISPDRGDVFKVSFNGGNPKKVQQVANALAARFIEENLRYREEKATETSAYVGDELELAKTTLDKKEAVMRDYKLKYYNEMPQQFESNSARLTALQTQLQKNRDSTQDLERTKILIQEQITLRKEGLSQQGLQARAGLEAMKRGTAVPNGGNPALAAATTELTQARQQLADLRSRYTDSHPEVKRLQKKVATLEESQAAMAADQASAKPAGQNAAASSAIAMAPLHDNQIDELVLQLKKADLDIASLNKESEGLKQQISQYESWLSMAPVREAEWNALTRDYEQLKNNYQLLVTRNLEAGAAESLERRQKGSQFKIVDSAYFPEKPIRPDFKKIMLLALAGGLGLGSGLAFLLEIQDSSFRDVSDVEDYLNLPVICAIPLIHTDKDKKEERRRALLWWLILGVSLLVLTTAMAYFYKTGRIII